MTATTGSVIFGGGLGDSNFRIWGSTFAAAMATCGLVQTSDTGQVNWSTVTEPVVNTFTVYEIYRFSDSLQASKPVFIRFSYGRLTASNTAAVRIQIGTGTDGAGNITGISTTITTVVLGIGVANSPAAYWASGDGSSIQFVSQSVQTTGTAPQWGGMFAIERSRDANATPNGDGLYLATAQIYASAAPFHQILSFTNSLVGNNIAVWPIPLSLGRGFTSYNTGSDGILFVPMVMGTPKIQGTPLSLLGCYQSEIPGRIPITVSLNGVTRTYLAITAATIGAKPMDGNATMGVLMRWE